MPTTLRPGQRRNHAKRLRLDGESLRIWAGIRFNVASLADARGAGGDVSISIGGFGGTKLGQTCGTASATAAAYQQVISKYSLKAVDFDLEEPEYENTAAINNELGAAQILQRNNPGLYVSITN